ncbi:hypothetical protein Tco_0146238 [Tanacetum coccineum]
MPADNVRGETFEEHDIYMNELLKSLNTADKDGITEDPFISIEKHVEMYLMYDETTHWRLRKPKVGEKVVAKCGQRPPKLSDPAKGKQRKQTKYPSASSDYFGSLVNYKWIAKVFGDKIKANPDIKLCDIADLVMKKYKCKVSPNQCTDAKKYALTEYEKTIGEHYSMLRSYEKVILDSNPGSTIKLGVTMNPDGKTYFDRFYVCFVGLSDGWKARCRKIIALDGSVLKSPNQGEILTAIGSELLEQDLGSSRGNGLTLMFDQHKVDRGCEAIENGFSECLNSVIVNVRHKPLLTMLEAIRVTVLERMNKMREISRKWNPRVLACNTYCYVKLVPSMNFWPDQSMYTTVLPPKPRKMRGRPRKKRIRYMGKGGSSTRISKRGPVRNEGAGGSRGGARESRGRRGDVGSRGGASGSRGGASVSRGVVGRSIGGSSMSCGASGSTGRGAGGSGDASGSRGRGAGGSGGVSGSRGRGSSGSKRKHVSTAGT